MKAEEQISPETFSVELRACGAETEFQKDVAALGIEDMVHFLPALPYRAAYRTPRTATLFCCYRLNVAITRSRPRPTNILRLHKPILALTTAGGDTAGLLNEAGGATIVDLADEDAIYDALPNFLQQVRAATHPLPTVAKTKLLSRRSQAERLAACLREAVAGLSRPDRSLKLASAPSGKNLNGNLIVSAMEDHPRASFIGKSAGIRHIRFDG